MKQIVEFVSMKEIGMSLGSIIITLGELNIHENRYFEECDHENTQVQVKTNDIIKVVTFCEFQKIFNTKINDIFAVDTIIFYDGITVENTENTEGIADDVVEKTKDKLLTLPKVKLVQLYDKTSENIGLVKTNLTEEEMNKALLVVGEDDTMEFFEKFEAYAKTLDRPAVCERVSIDDIYTLL
jgi:hypothetical protein